MAARLNPVSATAKDSSGAPPSCAIGSSGPSVWLKPTTPQGNPPNGTVDLSHSWATHSAANHTGQPGRRRTATASSPKRAGNTASHDGQRQPRNQPHQLAGPRQQRDIERQPEQEAVSETADQVVDSRVSTQASRANATNAVIPPAERRKARAQQQSAGDRDAHPGQPGHQRLTATG